jgi:hypothetical protein
MNPKDPHVVVPNTTRREALLAAVAGLLVLAFVGYGILHMSRPVTGNRLTGVIVGKEFVKQNKEERISFSGRKIENVKEIDGEYVLKVRVEKENRVYDVPVEKDVYDTKKEGDSLEFLRPESEQR